MINIRIFHCQIWIICTKCDLILLHQNVSIHCKNEDIWQSQTKELVVIDIIYHISYLVTIYLCVYYRLDEYKLHRSEEDEIND